MYKRIGLFQKWTNDKSLVRFVIGVRFILPRLRGIVIISILERLPGKMLTISIGTIPFPFSVSWSLF